jgi:hypothetical protein
VIDHAAVKSNMGSIGRMKSPGVAIARDTARSRARICSMSCRRCCAGECWQNGWASIQSVCCLDKLDVSGGSLGLCVFIVFIAAMKVSGLVHGVPAVPVAGPSPGPVLETIQKLESRRAATED